MVHEADEPKPTDNSQFPSGCPAFQNFANFGFHFPNFFICRDTPNKKTNQTLTCGAITKIKKKTKTQKIQTL